MSDVPSISSSAVTALQGGFSLLDRGAAEVVAGTQSAPSIEPESDTVEISSGSPIGGEPMLAGVRDMMLAREQISAGAALLHNYSQDRQSLFDMLK